MELPNTHTMTPLIVARNFWAAYEKKIAACNISFQVSKGEIFTLLGPNGSGKTTVLRAIAGVLPILKGDILVAGVSVRDNPVVAKRYIGYMIEGDRIYEEFTVLENVMMWAKFYSVTDAKNSAIRILEDIGLGGHLSTKAGKLSLGQKRKISLARALVHDPPILLLDEPTANLDPLIAPTLRGRLKEMARNKAIVYSTHNLYEAKEVATKIGVMIDGNLVIEGVPEELERAHGPLESIFKRLTVGQVGF